jgi:hypothetical protein
VQVLDTQYYCRVYFLVVHLKYRLHDYDEEQVEGGEAQNYSYKVDVSLLRDDDLRYQTMKVRVIAKVGVLEMWQLCTRSIL